jgi:hypothetical protein
LFIQTEQTPNPSTLKFLPGRVVMEKGTMDFAGAMQPRPRRSPGGCLPIEGVERVFFGADFVTVTKSADKDWQVLKPSILGGIMEHYTSGEPVIAGEASCPKAPPPMTTRSSPRSRNSSKRAYVRRSPRTAATSSSRIS